MKVSILTGGGDTPYALGLLESIQNKNLFLDFIGNDEMFMSPLVGHKNVNFLNLRGNQIPSASYLKKFFRLIFYYLRLVRYATITDSKIFHILWLNKFFILDAIFLNFYYKILGKKLIFTAHNINIKARDGGDNHFNSFLLKIMYFIYDHIFVHTEKMKYQLINNFNVPPQKISVIPFGINNTIPDTGIKKEQARKLFLLCNHNKVILFFGNIAPYKGLDILIDSFYDLIKIDKNYKLIIAGQIKNCCNYWRKIVSKIENYNISENILKFIEYIPDKNVENFFKAADVVVLPYNFIYQSGVLFLSYNFGLPVISTNVGSLKSDIVIGETGFICEPNNPLDLSNVITKYFSSDLFHDLSNKSRCIKKWANVNYSWNKVASKTISVYENLNKK